MTISLGSDEFTVVSALFESVSGRTITAVSEDVNCSPALFSYSLLTVNKHLPPCFMSILSGTDQVYELLTGIMSIKIDKAFSGENAPDSSVNLTLIFFTDSFEDLFSRIRFKTILPPCTASPSIL